MFLGTSKQKSILLTCYFWHDNLQDAGANCVKFQKTCLNEKFTKKYLERPYKNANSWGETYGEHKRHLEFSETQYRELFKYAHEVGILCTASAMDMVGTCTFKYVCK